MKKALPIVILIVIVALLVGGWMFLKKGKGGVSLPIPGEIKKEAGQEGESFTGKLKDAVARGLPMKCTYTQDSTTGTSYIKGSKVYAEITAQGKEGYIIMVDKCMWTWNKGESQGIKMCFEENVWEGEEGAGSAPTEAEYNCAPALVSDSQFSPPANVKFVDVEEMIGGAGE
ncbi:hypothetical protein CO054_00410 [Candidatus Shapirobacteria bacterium CG_4_9_14_0_2_um_filter_39_11]|uniref:Uncharacterized protein n=1 Tax=Candidatus Shapirobacteria bacterium CG_4_9_14_0_2_um_filter_39_11 TaxID=1974478 RepID=A0A2M8ETD9_9BACT|nr:MAG: hypothetical protein CO054_00410 [Candidatus Shapirobacteria bacterium CG_4_9_14_0_2_um_filter_39_11]